MPKANGSVPGKERAPRRPNGSPRWHHPRKKVQRLVQFDPETLREVDRHAAEWFGGNRSALVNFACEALLAQHRAHLQRMRGNPDAAAPVAGGPGLTVAPPAAYSGALTGEDAEAPRLGRGEAPSMTAELVSGADGPTFTGGLLGRF